jgi:hypothetical protein
MKIAPVILATFAAAATCTASTTSNAGYVVTSPPSCYKASDGSGSCSGTLASFRAAPDTTTYANFQILPSYAYFGASQGTTHAYCTVSTITPLWYSAVSAPPNTWFSISWNASGQCTYLTLEAGSFR